MGQPAKLANLLQVLGTVHGTWLGVSHPGPLGPGPSEWRPTLRPPSLSPTFLPTILCPQVRRHMRKQGRYTHHTRTLTPTQPVGTRAHAIHDLRRLAPADKSSRGADSSLLIARAFNLQHPTHVRPSIIARPNPTEPLPPRRRPRATRCLTFLQSTVSEAFPSWPTQLPGP